MKFIKENKAFIAILSLAALIRLIPIFNYQYSFDELSALSRTTYGNWHDLVLYGARIDAHPVLIQCFLYAIIQVFGYSEFWIKLPFIVFSLTAVIYVYKINLQWFGKFPALIAACVYSFSFIFLFYSPLARMYASGLFFSTALLYYWMKIIFDESRTKKDYVLTGLFFLLCALNAHISALFALSLGVAGLAFLKKNNRLNYFIACAVAVVLYLPHLPITFFQLDYGGIGSAQNGWLPPPGKLAFLEFIKTALGTGYVWLLFAVLICASFVINKTKVINRKSLLLLVIFFVNYFVIYFYSVLKAPVFQFSVMLFSVPALIVGLSGIMHFKEKYMIPVIGLISFVLLFQSVYKKEFFISAVLNQNEFQYNVLKQAAAKHGSAKVEAVFFDTEKYFLMHYELRDGKKQKYHMGYEPEISDVAGFTGLLSKSRADRIILGNPMPSQIEIVKTYFPFLEDFTETANVSCYTFSKTRSSRSDETPISFLNSSSIKNQADYVYSYNHNKESKRGNEFTYSVDSLNEYPFAIEALLSKVSRKSGNVVLAKIKLNSDTALSEVSFNCVIKNDKDSTLYFGGPEIRGFYSKNEPYWVYCELFVGSEYDNWLKQNSKLTFFIWNRGKHQFKIIDASVITLDFRPKRWALWE